MWRGPSLALLTTWALFGGVAAAAMTPENLRCEFRSQPLGIDNPAPRLSWALRSDAKDETQASYRVLVSTSKARLDRNQGDLWDSGTVSSNQQNNVAYAGKPLEPGQICYWKVAVTSPRGKAVWSRVSTWEMGLREWGARWISDSRPEAEPYRDDPAHLFRKEFSAKSQIVRARLYITGLGYYEASLNGKRIGDHMLDPGWTDFEKRVSYSTYDVTRLLNSGKNCLGVMVGNGWYNPLPLKLFGNFNLREHLTIGRPRLIAQLRIEYRDGTVDVIGSDPSWRVADGPIVRNNIYLGEVYDARGEIDGWNRAGFDDASWRKAVLAEGQVGKLIAQPQPPIRVTATWNAARVSEPKPGVFIYDMGVNFAGWASFKFDLPAGTKVTMRYGELLHKDGTLNPMTSVAGQIKRAGVGGPGAPDIAWQSDTFIAKGGKETYTPRFKFHGFRYVEITGLPNALPLSAVTASRLNSDVETVGTFECSNPLLNDIQAMCLRTFKSNIFSVQSDCPHRERLAYGGDIVATSEALMSNFDMSTFYEKAVRDWSDSALPNGMFTDTAPFIGIQYCGVVWAMAHPLLIEQLHQYYGNRQLGEEQYEAAKRWLGLVEKQYPDGIVKDGLSDHEGLEPTPAPELVTPMYFQCVQMVGKLAQRLGKTEDALHFEQLAAKIQTAYNAKYVDAATGKVGPGTQTSQSIALYTGIVPEAARAKVFAALVSAIEAKQGKLTTGILGTKFMLDVLSRERRSDLAYAIVTQPEFPGWAWMLKNGATTLWEHWEFSDNTFSHNHPMFGSVSQWMMHWLGGIRPAADAVGYDQVVIQPQTPPGLDWVKSSYSSIRGEIVSNWKRRQGGEITFEITVPPNTGARVVLPGRVTSENGKPFDRKIEQGGFTLGSGRYVFLALGD